MKLNRNWPALAAALAALAGAWLLAASPAKAQDGLVARGNDWLWPQVQARITVQTTALSPLGLARGGSETPVTSLARGVQAGALWGDYVFAAPSFGNFRATGGLVLGTPSGAPLAAVGSGSRLGVTVLDSPSAPGLGTSLADIPGAQPYLGLGYSSPALWGRLSVSADFGLVAGRPSALGSVGRALLGNQPLDTALREMRLAPLMQVGVRYTF